MVSFNLYISNFSRYSYLPCFILNNTPAKQLYSGIAMGEDSFTVFESALLRRGQRQHLHLNGLISLFKNRIVSFSLFSYSIFSQDTPTFRSQGDVRVSVMFEYEREGIPENGMFQLDDGLVPTLDRMCCGTMDSPIERISLLASWPNQCEDVLNEGHVSFSLSYIIQLFYRITVTWKKQMRSIGNF